MKITLNLSRPRNPLALAARSRRAGAHRPGPGALRQQARRALQRDIRRDLDSMKPPSP